MSKATWEYHVEDLPPDSPDQEVQDWLNTMGGYGWELISVRPGEVSDISYLLDRYVLRRPKAASKVNRAPFLPPVS
jgi:hypothetical protein